MPPWNSGWNCQFLLPGSFEHLERPASAGARRSLDGVFILKQSWPGNKTVFHQK